MDDSVGSGLPGDDRHPALDAGDVRDGAGCLVPRVAVLELDLKWLKKKKKKKKKKQVSFDL